MTPYEYLRRQHGEELPAWLDKHCEGDSFPREQFFASRIVYYPGSGTDGHPVKMFGSTHSAHCFIYADYGVNQQQLERELEDRQRRFRGYHTVARLELKESDIISGGWIPHVSPRDASQSTFQFAASTPQPFGFLEVLERDQDLDSNHGARRLAVLFLGADGIATYDALFCQGRDISPPFAVLLQDHGFGGSYSSFGQGGLLEGIAMHCDVFPTLLLVAEHTNAWDSFRRVPNVDGDRGGMHASLRFLYENAETSKHSHDEVPLKKLFRPTFQPRFERLGSG